MHLILMPCPAIPHSTCSSPGASSLVFVISLKEEQLSDEAVEQHRPTRSGVSRNIFKIPMMLPLVASSTVLVQYVQQYGKLQGDYCGICELANVEIRQNHP